MDNRPPNRNLGALLIVVGAALLAGAILLFTIDSDPTWLFGDPVFSTLLGLAAAGLLFLGWKKLRGDHVAE
jgi:hypothetical protein